MRRLAIHGLIATLAALITYAVTGCGGGYHSTVYGSSGKPYTAPTLCGALIQCKNASGESACYYDQATVTTATGSTEVGGCAEVSTKSTSK